MNKSEVLKTVEQGSLKESVPYFEVGDVVEVHCKITEGEKTRIQVFTGTVIGRSGGGVNESFTVRRVVNDQGVERTFPLHSPNVVDVKPLQSSKVRRAKLYFLRQRIGKAVKLPQRHTKHTVSK